jgi:arginyl-tRNA synthetase
MLADVVEDLSQRGIAQPSEGATCIFLEQNDAPFIVRKSDGAFTYATTDLATIKYRVEELQADLILYVVDARQSEHFQLLFGAAAKWGFDRVELRHIPFGTVLGDDRRPFKTRAGDTVGLESLLDESIRRARAVVDENDDAKTDSAGQPTPELDEAARSEVAQAVAIGGVKYADLNHNRESDYVFSWEKMLAKNGDTATYIQYSAARINGIFRRGDIDRVELRKSAGKFTITAPAERALALQLNRFVEELEAAAVDFRPNIVTSYLFETANRFGAFYEKCSVLKEEDPAVRSSRLLLCDLTSRVLERGLQLLGIRTCERM